MVPDLQIGIALDHQRELQDEADLRRLAAEAAPPAALRLRLGRQLVSLGHKVSGSSGSRHPAPCA
jgi:hypothetical protein